VGCSVVRSADGRGAFRQAQTAAPDSNDGAAWQASSSGLGGRQCNEEGETNCKDASRKSLWVHKMPKLLLLHL